jgi:hypothetical protein
MFTLPSTLRLATWVALELVTVRVELAPEFTSIESELAARWIVAVLPPRIKVPEPEVRVRAFEPPVELIASAPAAFRVVPLSARLPAMVAVVAPASWLTMELVRLLELLKTGKVLLVPLPSKPPPAPAQLPELSQMVYGPPELLLNV